MHGSGIRSRGGPGWRGVLACLCLALGGVGATCAQDATLCAAGETILFNCRIQGEDRLASVCASPQLAVPGGYLRYRFGKPGAVELEFPAATEHSYEQFAFSRYTRHRVTKISLNFQNAGHVYSIFDSYDAESGPAQREQGVQVIRPQRRGTPVSLMCAAGGLSHLESLEGVVPCSDALGFSPCRRD